MKQSNKYRLFGCAAELALGVGIGSTAQAQNAPANNPNGGGNNGPAADYRNLTPPQRQLLQEQVRDFTRAAMIRLMLENAGFTDKALQDTVVDFANAREKGMTALRTQQGQLMQTLFDQGTT